MAKKAKQAESKPKKTPAKPAKAKPGSSKPVAGKLARAAVSKPAESATLVTSNARPATKGANSKAAAAAPKYASLEEARSATVDALLAVIEEAEHRLSAAKRADSIDELVKLGQGMG